MKLQLNGEQREFSGVSTLAGLIQQLALKGDRIAVELNREIVSREQWPATELHDGDRLEIVHFVGGGAAVTSSQFRVASSNTSRRQTPGAVSFQ